MSVLYLATCNDCTPRLPQTFLSDVERMQWSTIHAKATGHSVQFNHEVHP